MRYTVSRTPPGTLAFGTLIVVVVFVHGSWTFAEHCAGESMVNVEEGYPATPYLSNIQGLQFGGILNNAGLCSTHPNAVTSGLLHFRDDYEKTNWCKLSSVYKITP